MKENFDIFLIVMALLAAVVYAALHFFEAGCLTPTPPPWAAHCPVTISTGRLNNSEQTISPEPLCIGTHSGSFLCLGRCAQKSERNFVRGIDRK